MKKAITYEFIDHFKHIPAYCTVVGIKEFELHWHRDYEMIMLLEGKLSLVMKDEEMLMSPGDVLLINSYTPHLFQDIGEDNLVLLLQFSPKLVHIGDENEKGRQILFHCNSLYSDTTQEDNFHELRKYLVSMGLETTLRRSGYRHMIQGKIYEIIAHLYRNFQYEVVQDQKSSSFISSNDLKRAKKVIDYVEEHLTEDVSLATVSKAMFMSKSTLSHFFKDVIGVSYSYYIDTIRLNRSTQMLLTTQTSILEIALSCGYNNDQSMYRAYQKRLNMTPNQYRKQRQQDKAGELSDYMGYKFVDKTKVIHQLELYM